MVRQLAQHQALRFCKSQVVMEVSFIVSDFTSTQGANGGCLKRPYLTTHNHLPGNITLQSVLR